MESVWDYPRPPRVEPSPARVVVELDGEVLADTRRSLRVLETSHPPVYYIPAADIRTERLRPSARRYRLRVQGGSQVLRCRRPRRGRLVLCGARPRV
jgi:uncharacterized protein (DUF427 family)